MKTAASEYAMLVRYLLGELTEQEQEPIEERYMFEERFAEMRAEVEMDLVDAYVSGSLTAAQRHDFETRYMITRERKQAVLAASISRVYREGIAARAPKPRPVWSRALPVWLR